MDKQKLRDQNKLIAEELVKALADKGKTIATAESCTGGMIGQTITSVPGASECYGFGFITYANEAKTKLIGVSEQTLAAFGAVSEQTACEMALGAVRASGADIAVSVTGIAGPGGGTFKKPVGLVYIGFAEKDGSLQWRKNVFEGDREEVRLQTVYSALDIVIKNI